MERSHEAGRLLSHHHLHRKIDKMKLPKFLCIPKLCRPTRSETRSEISPIEGQGEPDPTVPRPTESTPDLRIGTSTLPVPGPLTPRDENSGGMQMTSSRTTHLTTPFRVTQTPTPFPIKFYLFLEETKPASRNLQIVPLTKDQLLRESRTGRPPRTPRRS